MKPSARTIIRKPSPAPTKDRGKCYFHHVSSDRLRPGCFGFQARIQGRLPWSRFRSRPDVSKKTRRFPKLNRMPHPPHGVKVETEVVDRIQDLRQHLVRRIKVPQVGTRIALPHAAGAIRVERALI